MKRTLSFILAALMLSSALLSCSESTTEETAQETSSIPAAEESIPEETEDVILDDLPEMDFDGHNYVIYNANSDGNTWFTTVYVDFEEDSGEPIPSSIYYRNLAVEDRFDVLISEIYETGANIKTIIQAGSAEGMDLTLLDGSDAISFITSGYLYDLNTLDHIDLDKPYWDQNSRNYLSIKGKYFEGVGDFMTTHIDETICLFFNKGLIDMHQLENPYELVDNYKWTYDKIHEMGVKACLDANGDGIRNDNDNYALTSWTGVLYPFFLYGSGETYVAKDENDVPFASYYNERFISAFEKVIDICHSEGDTFTYDANIMQNTRGLSNNHRVQEIMFPNNQSLFWVECVCWAKALRDMETDFGIVTAPMLDETQGQYYNFCNGNFYGQCVPVTLTGEALDRTCIVMEALNSHSTSTVLATYYDIALKTKYSRDEESGRMLDLIFANRIYDVSTVFDIASINGSINDMCANNNKDLASFYKRNQRVTDKLIENMLKKMGD